MAVPTKNSTTLYKFPSVQQHVITVDAADVDTYVDLVTKGANDNQLSVVGKVLNAPTPGLVTLATRDSNPSDLDLQQFNLDTSQTISDGVALGNPTHTLTTGDNADRISFKSSFAGVFTVYTMKE